MSAPFMGEDRNILEGDSEGIERERGAFETMGNTIALSSKDMTTKSLIRFNNLKELNADGDKFEPDELREMFPENKELFSFPLTKTAAESIVAEAGEREKLEREIALGPDSFAFGTVNFIAGMIPHAIDPVDLIAGVGVGKVLSVASKGARLFKLLSKVNKTGTGRLASQFGEAAIGNAIVEPVVFATAGLEGRDYTVTDAFVNSIGGALLGTVAIKGLTKGGKLAWKGVPAVVKKFGKGSSKAFELNVKSAITQLNGGKMVDIQAQVRDVIAEQAPTPNARRPSLDLEKLKTTESVFASIGRPIGDDLGDSLTYMSFDRSSVNGVAASKHADSRAPISEYKVRKPLKLLDIDRAIPPELDALVKSRVKKGLKEGPRPTLREAMDEMRHEGILDDFAKDVAEKGWDGFYNNNSKMLGQKATENDILGLFGTSKIEKVGEGRADPKSVSKISEPNRIELAKSEQARQDSPLEYTKNDLDASQRELIDSEFKADEEMDIKFDAAIKDAEFLVDQGFLTKEELVMFRDAKAETKEAEQGLAAALICMGK